MLKILVPALLCTIVAAPALAETSAEPFTFTRGGVTYVAAAETKGDVTVIRGHEKGSGTPFNLFLAHGRVRGIYGNTRMSFAAPASSGPTETASR